MTATTQLQMPLLPTLDVFSDIVVTDPRVSSTDDFYGVESVRHVLDFEARQFRTEIVASGRVIGGHHRWLRMQTRPGQAAPPSPERVVGGGRVMPKPIGVTATEIIRGVALDVPVPPVNLNRWAETEVHISTAPGFTPDASTLKDAGKKTHFEITSGLVSGTTYYLRTFYVDVKGNKSLASDEVSAVAGQVISADLTTKALVQIADEFESWNVDESLWNTRIAANSESEIIHNEEANLLHIKAVGGEFSGRFALIESRKSPQLTSGQTGIVEVRARVDTPEWDWALESGFFFGVERGWSGGLVPQIVQRAGITKGDNEGTITLFAEG